MELAWFIPAFARAASRCREFAQLFVIEELPSSLRFDFRAAERTPGPDGRIKFLGGRLLAPTQLRGVEPVRARNYLWVDGRVPAWVNLSVHAADAEHTFIEVCATNRLVGEVGHMYHQREGNPPFHLLGPALPPEWVSVEVSGRFNLGWRSGKPTNS